MSQGKSRHRVLNNLAFLNCAFFSFIALLTTNLKAAEILFIHPEKVISLTKISEDKLAFGGFTDTASPVSIWTYRLSTGNKQRLVELHNQYIYEIVGNQEFVFWTQNSEIGRQIMRVRLDNLEIKPFHSRTVSTQLIIHNQDLYWIESFSGHRGGYILSQGVGGGRIRRLHKINGRNLRSLTVDNKRIYFQDYDWQTRKTRTFTMDHDGRNVVMRGSLNRKTRPRLESLDGNFLFSTVENSRTRIYLVDYDRGSHSTLYSSVEFMEATISDSFVFYFSNSAQLLRYPLEGGDAEPVDSTRRWAGSNLTYIDDYLVWVERNKVWIHKP